MDNTVSKIPKHVAIIPDGNRRWAKENGKSSLEGHMAGRDRIIELIEKASQLGIETITFWLFSTENWKRSKEEVDYLMNVLFIQGYKKYADKFREMKSRFVHLGRKDRLPEKLVKILSDLEEETKDYQAKTVCFAIDYGGRDELKRAVQKILARTPSAEEISDDMIRESLDTAAVSDPDMIIRTSGENRLSGFMAWQAEYAELFFEPSNFPDFTPEKFEKLVNEFALRTRTFGGDSKTKA